MSIALPAAPYSGTSNGEHDVTARIRQLFSSSTISPGNLTDNALTSVAFQNWGENLKLGFTGYEIAAISFELVVMQEPEVGLDHFEWFPPRHSRKVRVRVRTVSRGDIEPYEFDRTTED